ncbi:MAG: DUF364 domain-containing protein, partial [Burkholderiaceae bacterium]
MATPKTLIAHDLVSQLETVAQRFAPPRITRLHLPADSGTAAQRTAAFCAVELDVGAFGLSYLLLGDTLHEWLASHGAAPTLQGLCPLALARDFVGGSGFARAIALACINALTDSAWRRLGYAPPAAGNSLGDMQLTAADHLGMIGFFPPLVRHVRDTGARLTVVELDDATVRRQQARFPDVTITLDRSALATCNVVVGTSTMLLNDTLDAMLA